MNKTVKVILGASAAFGVMCSSAIALQVDWKMETTGALYQDGSIIPTGGLTFEVGTFNAGFDFGGSSFADWVANWNTAGLAGNSTTWTNLNQGGFESFGRLGATGTASSVVRPEGPVGSQGYIWGYTSLDVSSNPEWIIITNTDWIFPNGTPSDQVALQGAAWSAADAGTTMIFGSAFNIPTAGALERSFQTQAIPEPSTYALIFGLGILGFLGYRRVRK